MREIEPLETIGLFPGLLAELVKTLKSLASEEWDLPTPCPRWSVHDLASHVLGVEVGQLSMGRDGHRAALIDGGDWDDLVAGLNDQNERWVRAMKGVSPRLLIDLIGSTGQQTNRYLASVDPLLPGPIVSWTGATPAPMWLHIAREYTERWHHQQQIRMAAGRPLLTDPYWFAPVITTFMHGLPRSYSGIEAPPGSAVRVSISGPSGGNWLVVRKGSNWLLNSDDSSSPDAHTTIGEIDAWRLFTRSVDRDTIKSRIRIKGDRELGLTALSTVSIIA